MLRRLHIESAPEKCQKYYQHDFQRETLRKSNPTVAQGPLLFSAASYNIHQSVGPDGRRDDRRIVQVLQNLDAGIIGLQEVDSQASGDEIFQLKYLTRETDLKAVAGPTMRRRDSDFGNVLLTRYKILEVRNVDLSVSRREPRGAIDVDLDIGGTIVRVIVTHLGLSGRERRRQTHMLSDLVSGHRDRMVVVLGDLNEWHPYGRRSGAWRAISANPQDCALFLHGCRCLRSTASGFGPNRR